MQLKRFRLRFRRQLRAQQQQVEDLGQQAEAKLERHLLRRFGRLKPVRRFVTAWVLLFVLVIGCLTWQIAGLSDYYQRLQPIPGGIYVEGQQGSFTNANPLYATSGVDSTVARLVFAGLFTYTNQNQLTGELADTYSVDSTGTIYTVHLRPHLRWQDGAPLTSADVVFTYRTIQNPDAESPLNSSWQGISLSAPTADTVQFTLPSPLASFPYNLTTGIIPQHILGKMAAADMRSANFNTTAPVGAGPFSWHGLQVSGSNPSNAEEQIGLAPFDGFATGAPKLHEFIVHAFASQDQMVDAFRHGQLTAVADLSHLPSDLSNDPTVQRHNLLLTAGTYVFFRTSAGVLSDPKVRQALVDASQPDQIIDHLGYTTRPVREPLLEGQLAYDPSVAQHTDDLVAAKTLLDQDGWILGNQGSRTKNGQPLQFNLVAADTPEYRQVSKELQQQWRALGVKTTIQIETSDDYQSALQNHSYDATLYGISIGVDPDVFVYWDSSQADIRSSRLNLSEYNSPTADAALEAGRTRLDPTLRVIKYKPFLQSWQQDAPALGLYQPRFLYLTHGNVYGLTNHAINNQVDRFDNVQNWEIRTAKTTD